MMSEEKKERAACAEGAAPADAEQDAHVSENSGSHHWYTEEQIPEAQAWASSFLQTRPVVVDIKSFFNYGKTTAHWPIITALFAVCGRVCPQGERRGSSHRARKRAGRRAA
jgi:hypothetical protein